MMFVPCTFFIMLSVYWWIRHQGFDVCVYMSALYALTTLLAAIIVVFGMLDSAGILFDEYNLELGVLPTLVFCATLTVGMLPFSLIYKKEIKRIATPNPMIFYLFSWFLIGISFINLYLVADSTLDILQGDLHALRQEHYDGFESPAQLKALTLPSIVAYLYYFNTATVLAIPLFFYYLCFEQRAWWFKLLLLFASLSMPIVGIQVIDRTEPVYYGMMFLFCLILFYPFISRKVKRIIYSVTVPIGLIMAVYVGAVSEARFSEREDGTIGGIVKYAGQGYLNFCYFWEKGNRDEISAERELPLIYRTVLHVDNNDERRNDRSGKHGFWISVFATYVGDVLLDLTPIGLAIWMLFFFTVSVIVVKAPHRDEFTVGELLAIFILAAIPIFGVFYYRHMSYQASLMLLLVAFLYVTDKFQIRI